MIRIAYISKDRKFFEREIENLNAHIDFTLVNSIESCRGRKFDTFMLGYDYFNIKDHGVIIKIIKQNIKYETSNRNNIRMD